jgi:hypothetical protein
VSRDEEIRAVAAELEARLADLRAAVNALSAVLLPPGADPGMERTVTP